MLKYIKFFEPIKNLESCHKIIFDLIKKHCQGRLIQAQAQVLGRGVLSVITCLNHGLMNHGKDLRSGVPLVDRAFTLMIMIRAFFNLSGKRVSHFEV